ncbi:hypothetical protein, partial [Escherichia coli]
MRTKVQALRKKQKNTLDQIFKTPVPQGIKWSDIESLVKALGGEIKEGRGSRCKFILNMSVVDSIGQRNSYVKTWGCGGFLNETNI